MTPSPVSMLGLLVVFVGVATNLVLETTMPGLLFGMLGGYLYARGVR